MTVSDFYFVLFFIFIASYCCILYGYFDRTTLIPIIFLIIFCNLGYILYGATAFKIQTKQKVLIRETIEDKNKTYKRIFLLDGKEIETTDAKFVNNKVIVWKIDKENRFGYNETHYILEPELLFNNGKDHD